MRYGVALLTGVLMLGGLTGGPVAAQEPAAAQQPPAPPPDDMRITRTTVRQTIGSVTRSELCHEDLLGADGQPVGMDVICALIEIPPGASLPKHFHYGLETAYVLEDATIQEVGKAQLKLDAGTVLIQPRGTVHDGNFIVVGDKPLRLYTVHVVDKDRPLYNFINEPRPAPAAKGTGKNADKSKPAKK